MSKGSIPAADAASTPTDQAVKPVVTWDKLAAVAKAVLAGDRVDDLNRDAVTLALAYGLIESCERTKPCASCGTPKFDFRYWRVTGAGRLLVQAQGELAEATTANSVGTEAEGRSAPTTPPVKTGEG